MLKRLMIVGMTTLITSSSFVISPSFAQETNLASMKCGDFLALNAQDSSHIMTWLMGYFTYEDDPAVIDAAKEKAKETQIRQYCGDHKDLDFLDAADIFMDKKYKG